MPDGQLLPPGLALLDRQEQHLRWRRGRLRLLGVRSKRRPMTRFGFLCWGVALASCGGELAPSSGPGPESGPDVDVQDAGVNDGPAEGSNPDALPPECPDADGTGIPVPDECSVNGQHCASHAPICGFDCVCTNGKWQCTCAISCPRDPPDAGQPCPSVNLRCKYGDLVSGPYCACQGDEHSPVWHCPPMP
jgi:hypothetical protein